MPRFANQVAIVTGGAQGIGFAIAQRFGEEGAHVVLFDVNDKFLQEAKKQLESQKIQATVFVVDVTNEQNVKTAVQSVVSKLNRIDVLVCCAGITGQTNKKTHEVDAADFDRVVAINLRGVYLCNKHVLPSMIKANYGRIVNIASIAGKEGNAGMLAYSSSKSGVIGLTKVIGKEYAETGITCNAIAPAVVRTKMVADMPAEQVKYMTDKIPMKRTGELTEIASLVSFIASKESSFTTGFVWDATGGRATY